MREHTAAGQLVAWALGWAESFTAPEKKECARAFDWHGVHRYRSFFHENQTPRSDSAKFFVLFVLKLILCPQILEPSS